MDEFQEKILTFSKQLKEKKKGIHNEETTKIALILPFLQVLGYDITNPAEVKAEYTADIGTKQGEKVDIAIFNNQEISIIIECKSKNTTLKKEHLSQLLRYYSITEAKIGILTNGIIWRFYADTKKQGIMDQTPFLELDLENVKKSAVDKLENFTKNKFNTDIIEESINELKYKHDLKEVLITELNNPSDELVRVLTKKVYEGVVTKHVLKQFRHMIKLEINQIIQEKLDKTLNDAIENNELPLDPVKFEIKETKEVTTTQEEINAYNIIKAICSEIANPETITIKDTKSYCGILYKNNNRRPIARLHLDNSDNKRIELFDKNTSIKGKKQSEKHTIETINDIYNYKEEIQLTVRLYTQLEKQNI